MDEPRRTGGKVRRLATRRVGSPRLGLGPGRPPGLPLTVFVHIPKTAGTTFGDVLRDNFPGGVGTVGNVFKGSGGFDPQPIRRLREEAALRTRHMQVLTGHIPFAAGAAFAPDTRYVTFLRDPVERLLSQYYGLRKASRRHPLPGDGSLTAVVAQGNILYGDLQTRMLSDAYDPGTEVDEQALAQAKENLRTFAAFGLVERFDESLALLGSVLDLASIAYIQERVTTRPRAAEVPEEMTRLAEEMNRYDIELYAYAQDLFAQRIADLGLGFSVTVAAMHVVRTGVIPPPPPEQPRALWDLAVRARADLLIDRRARARAPVSAPDDLRDLVVSLGEQVGGPAEPMAAPAPKPKSDRRAPRPVAAAPQPDGPRAIRGSKRGRLVERADEVAALRDEVAARLAELGERIATIEREGGETGSIELERLRREAGQVGKRVEQLTARIEQLRERAERAGRPGAARGRAQAD